MRKLDEIQISGSSGWTVFPAGMLIQVLRRVGTENQFGELFFLSDAPSNVKSSAVIQGELLLYVQMQCRGDVPAPQVGP